MTIDEIRALGRQAVGDDEVARARARGKLREAYNSAPDEPIDQPVPSSLRLARASDGISFVENRGWRLRLREQHLGYYASRVLAEQARDARIADQQRAA